MSKSIVNPLQSIISKAATALPVETGRVAPYLERQNRLKSGSGTVILADISSSMTEIAWDGKTKYKLLQDAVRSVRHLADYLVAFGSSATVCAGELPEPWGSTDMENGLEVAGALKPGRILLISDGEPDNKKSALKKAQSFPGIIDVLYIGPDNNKEAIEFLKMLAKSAHGNYQACDLTSSTSAPRLAHEMQQLMRLTGPSI